MSDSCHNLLGPFSLMSATKGSEKVDRRFDYTRELIRFVNPAQSYFSPYVAPHPAPPHVVFLSLDLRVQDWPHPAVVETVGLAEVDDGETVGDVRTHVGDLRREELEYSKIRLYRTLVKPNSRL